MGLGMLRWLLLAAAAVTLVSCATPYQDYGLTGGANVTELRPDVFRVSFGGNGFTTRESVQVYWLKRCADLAIEKGFAGFEILSDMQFAMKRPSATDRPGKSQMTFSASGPDSAARPARPLLLTAVFVYSGGGGAPKPAIEGDVHFLRGPVEPAPPKVFNARVLLAQLDPLINGEKCGGNICPHVHEYLLPKGKLGSPPPQPRSASNVPQH